MKEMRLMQIIGDIDEKYIDEAAPAEQKKKAMRFTPWVRYASIAACAMLVIGVGIFAITQHMSVVVSIAYFLLSLLLISFTSTSWIPRKLLCFDSSSK